MAQAQAKQPGDSRTDRQRDLDDKALYKAFRQWLPMGLVDTYELSWTAVGVYCMDYGDAVDDALGRRRGQAAVDAYVESVFAANPDERARCEAAAAENLKVKASLMAEFLEQEKAKAEAAAAASATAAAGPAGGESRPLAASAAPADAGARASDEPALAGTAASAAPDTAVAQPVPRAAEAPALPEQAQAQAAPAPLAQPNIFVLGRAVKRPAEDPGASGSGAKKPHTEQPAVSRVAPPVAVLHPQAQPTASAPAAYALPVAVVPDAASGNAVHQTLDDAAAEPPALQAADAEQRARHEECVAAREKAEEARNAALEACSAAQTALLAAIAAEKSAGAELEQESGTHAAAVTEFAAASAVEAAALAAAAEATNAKAAAAARLDATVAAVEAKRMNMVMKAGAAQAAEKASNRATAASFKLNADLSAAKRAQKTAEAALKAMAA